MSVYNVNDQSLLALASRVAQKGDWITVAEILDQQNDMLKDVVWKEANGIQAHKSVIRSGLPEATPRRINQGVQPSAGQTNETHFGIKEYMAKSEIDKRLVEIAPNGPEFRNSEARAHVEGMSQGLQRDILYSARGQDSYGFNGLASVLSKLGPTVVSAGGEGNSLTSIYCVVWGDRQAYCVYPKGALPGGIKRTDMGVQEIEEKDKPGFTFPGYVEYFEMSASFCYDNPRAIGRLANIDTTQPFDPAPLYDLLAQMDVNKGRAFFYTNRRTQAQILKQADAKGNVNYSSTEVWASSLTTFSNIPFRMVEQILDTESEVTA